MLNIDNEIKELYKQDSIPKALEINFQSLSLTISNSQIVSESFSLEESLFSDTDIRFGSCESSEIKFTVADITQDLKGHVFTISQIIDGNAVPLGKYTVHSCKKQNDLRFKDIVAYDNMKKADIDVSDWYNGLTFPILLKNFRASLLSHLGIEEELKTLPNDNMTITKTMNPTKLKGREVLVCLEELNGSFGHINRLGKFTHVVLEPSYGLYPALTLLPSNDLYPVSANDTSYFQQGSESVHVNYSMYSKVRFEEYTTKEITKLQIRQEEGDIGSIVGNGTNLYVIEGNFLVYGKSANELETIAINAFGNMQKRPYRPFESENIGLPYIEVGDTIAFETSDNVASYVFHRTLKGIQALRDSFSATGSEEIEQSFSLNKLVEQLQGKSNVMIRNVEELSNTITDVEEGLEAKITQTASNLNVKLTDLEDDLYAELNILAGEIDLKVDANGVIAAINLSPGTVKIQANKIDLTGYATFTALETSGATEIHGGNLKTGTVVADTVRASWVYAGNINASQITAGAISGDRINGGTISGVTFISTGTSNSTTITNGYINTTSINLQQSNQYTLIGPNGITISNGSNSAYIGPSSIQCANFIGLANSAYSVRNTANSYYYAYLTANDNFVPTYSNMYLGSSGSLWAGVYALNGTINTSDERRKDNIMELDIRFLEFAKRIVPYTYQMIEGTSGRYHLGFIAQRIEEYMSECGISSDEFAGLIKSPVYAERLEDGEFDTSSEIIDYQYALRYSEFIPLIFLWMKDLENKINNLL